MKKLLSLILAAILFAFTLASCASLEKRSALDPRIRLTSSDASDAAAWLSDRLGDRLTGRVVLGTSADGYALDLSTLEDDGYFIRACGGEDVLFAKTAVGLDRAVRKYARMAEAGAVTDVTSHEGFRVKSLTVAGNDISEYAIVRVTESDPCVTTAASELASYVAKSCGASLPVCTEADFAASGATRRIAISSGDESLGDEGFRLSIDEDGNIAIIGGVWRGSLFGVYGLLEDIGWRFTGGSFIPKDRQEYLYEAERVDLAAAINRTEIPSIPIRGGVCGLKQRNTYSTEGNPNLGGYGFAVRSCHGLAAHHWEIFSGEYEGLYKGLYVEWRQPCFSNEDILEAIDNYAMNFVQSRLNAGQQIGRELIAVDVAQYDGMWYMFCSCKNCLAVEKVEGYHSGPYLRMANRVCALLDENFPGMCASILAYCGTDTLPNVTRPAHNLYVAYCFYLSDAYESCQNHCISGVDCGWTASVANVSNKIAAERFEEWAAVTDPSMFQIWYYPLKYNNYCYNMPIYLTLLDDMKYLASFGVGHVYLCAGGGNGNVNMELACYLCSKFAWDATITDEEGLALMREWFDIVYGDAGDLLFDLAILEEQAGDRAGCWGSFNGHTMDLVDYAFIADHAGQILATCEKALGLAQSESEYDAIEKYATGFRFLVVLSLYDEMYVNGTKAERDEIAALYREVWESFRRHERATFYGADFFYAPQTFDPDVHPHDWVTNEIHKDEENGD